MSEVPGLGRLRARIDALDRKVLAALARRFEVVREIGELKRAHRLDTYQKTRWEALMAARLALGAELGLDPRFTRDFFTAVHEEALRLQRAPAKNRSWRAAAGTAERHTDVSAGAKRRPGGVPAASAARKRSPSR